MCEPLKKQIRCVVNNSPLFGCHVCMVCDLSSFAELVELKPSLSSLDMLMSLKNAHAWQVQHASQYFNRFKLGDRDRTEIWQFGIFVTPFDFIAILYFFYMVLHNPAVRLYLQLAKKLRLFSTWLLQIHPSITTNFMFLSMYKVNHQP